MAPNAAGDSASPTLRASSGPDMAPQRVRAPIPPRAEYAPPRRHHEEEIGLVVHSGQPAHQNATGAVCAQHHL